MFQIYMMAERKQFLRKSDRSFSKELKNLRKKNNSTHDVVANAYENILQLPILHIPPYIYRLFNEKGYLQTC